jgi:hypothetical protein
VLSDLSVLKAEAISNINAHFSDELSFTSECYSIITTEYKNLYPEHDVSLVGSALRLDSQEKENTISQTSYLTFAWFNRIHQCRGLIEGLLTYRSHFIALQQKIPDAFQRQLPKVDWQTTLSQVDSQRLKDFIQLEFNNPQDKQLFADFLDGRCFLPLKNNGTLGGRSFQRQFHEVIASALLSVNRLINDNATKVDFFSYLYINSDEVRNVISSLHIKKISLSKVTKLGGQNIIYYGAPGTGKSRIINESIDEAYAERTVFHADTQNSDFLGCLKPKMKGGVIVYEFRSGPFTNAIVKAFKNPSEQHWLVIEEINRAPAAAVFGEIFQLLDRNSEGESSYSINLSDQDMISYIEVETERVLENGKLKIPSNLTLLATMNSSDQAVMPLDTAFKRRWSFRYIPIDFDNSFVASGKPCAEGSLDIQGEAGVGKKTQEQQISWKNFAIAINIILTENSIPEDKHLGPFFLTKNELTRDNRMESLTGKLFMYLWDDVLRHGMTELIFDEEIKTYGQLVRYCQEKKTVFNDKFYDLVRDQIYTIEEDGSVEEDDIGSE